MNSLLLIQSLFINCKHVLFKFILFSASVHNHLDDTYTTILKNWYKWDFFLINSFDVLKKLYCSIIFYYE